jgi:Rrf2 family protein
MKSSKLMDVLHILMHMSLSSGTFTSESLSKAMNTNPVVVRRVMAGLREHGFVTSEKGHHGGWRLACDLGKVTLYDIYSALELPSLIAMESRNASTECLVEKAVNATTDEIFDFAEKQILNKFKTVTLAQLQETIQHQMPNPEQHINLNIEERVMGHT